MQKAFLSELKGFVAFRMLHVMLLARATRLESGSSLKEWRREGSSVVVSQTQASPPTAPATSSARYSRLILTARIIYAPQDGTAPRASAPFV